MMRSMDDFIQEGEDNFFEAMHHELMVLEEEIKRAKNDCWRTLQEGRASAHGLRMPGDDPFDLSHEDSRSPQVA
jgi:hypothetical protein